MIEINDRVEVPPIATYNPAIITQAFAAAGVPVRSTRAHPGAWPDHLSGRALQLRTIWQRVEALPLPHWRVVHLHYREGLTLEEIGPRMHLSVSRISQIRKEAIGLLRASVEATPEREAEPPKCRPIRPPYRPAA